VTPGSRNGIDDARFAVSVSAPYVSLVVEGPPYPDHTVRKRLPLAAITEGPTPKPDDAYRTVETSCPAAPAENGSSASVRRRATATRGIHAGIA